MTQEIRIKASTYINEIEMQSIVSSPHEESRTETYGGYLVDFQALNAFSLIEKDNSGRHS